MTIAFPSQGQEKHSKEMMPSCKQLISYRWNPAEQNRCLQEDDNVSHGLISHSGPNSATDILSTYLMFREVCFVCLNLSLTDTFEFDLSYMNFCPDLTHPLLLITTQILASSATCSVIYKFSINWIVLFQILQFITNPRQPLLVLKRLLRIQVLTDLGKGA